MDERIRCAWLDDRNDFLGLISCKLGDEYSLELSTAAELADEEHLRCFDAAIIAMRTAEYPGYAGRVEALQRLAANRSGVPVVALLQAPDRSLMHDALEAGAYDYLLEMAPLDEFRIVLRRATRYYQARCELGQIKSKSQQLTDFGSISTSDPKMMAIFSMAKKIAYSDANILITGETGTGKELLAKAIHACSPRSLRPFVPVACSSLPEQLIEAELFGHEKGAFTGAVCMRRGRFEVAERGTIFLDEIGELAPGLQVKLLRVLQERSFERLGSNQPRPMEARIISATNRNLGILTQAGAFRADLYYRLNTVEIELPPLRDRTDDIVTLAHLFLRRYAEYHNRPARRLSPAALCVLKKYGWPGNVRELEHVVERAVVICDGPELDCEHLPNSILRHHKTGGVQASLEDEVRSFKRRLIEKSLRDSQNNKVQAARLLGVSRSSLHRLIDELGIRATSCDYPPAA